MNYMEKAWEVSQQIVTFYAESKYTDKDGHVWLGVEGETHDKDQWVREDGLGAISSADMMKKMINELMDWDTTPVVDPYEYNIVRTSREDGFESGPWLGYWIDLETAKDQLARYISAEEDNEKEHGFRYADYRMIKRRKVGRIEDV